MSIRRILLFSILLVAAYLGVCAIRTALASDETRIGWLFADEAAAFNDAAAMSVLSNFAPEWHDETMGISREALHRGLLWLFRNRRDGRTQRFLHRVAVGEFAVDVQGERATAVVPLVLYQGVDAEERAVWELRVTADLGKRDGSWRIERSRHETVSGGMPR
jgi:hypothetical protein